MRSQKNQANNKKLYPHTAGMKKISGISFILLLICTLLIGATACGGTSAQQEERTPQERTISPDPVIDEKDTVKPEPPERPECPHCPKRPPVHGPSRLPHIKTIEDDEEPQEGVPVPYDENNNKEGGCDDRHAHRPPPPLKARLPLTTVIKSPRVYLINR